MNYQHNIISGSKTHTGLTTQFNSDAMVDFPINGGHVFVVSDGHDGENGHGALAAKICVESIKKYFLSKTYKNINNALTNAVTYANYSIFEQASKDPKYKGFAATVAILICFKDQAYYAYAGDSRIYYLSNGVLSPLTQDHVSNIDEASTSDVTVLVGENSDIKFGVSIKALDILPDFHFLVCTDGLTDKVSIDEIKTVLSDEDTFPEHKALLLTEKAIEKEEGDNITVQVIEFGSRTPLQAAPKEKVPSAMLRTVLIVALSIIGALVLSIGGYKGYAYLSNSEKSEVDENIANKEKKKDNRVSVVVRSNNDVVDAVEEENVNDIEPLSSDMDEENIVENQKTEASSYDVSDSNEPIYYKHKIAYGENLYRLGLRYNVSQEQLISLNGAKASNLVADSKIKIPVKATCTVSKGESWSVISDRYNVKIKSIAKASNVDGSVALNEGQKLIIPLR